MKGREHTKTWQHGMTFNHYANDKLWATPIGAYPFLSDGNFSPLPWSLHRQKDLVALGYHKNGKREYLLDVTACVARLQQRRTVQSPQ